MQRVNYPIIPFTTIKYYNNHHPLFLLLFLLQNQQKSKHPSFNLSLNIMSFLSCKLLIFSSIFQYQSHTTNPVRLDFIFYSKDPYCPAIIYVHWQWLVLGSIEPCPKTTCYSRILVCAIRGVCWTETLNLICELMWFLLAPFLPASPRINLWPWCRRGKICGFLGPWSSPCLFISSFSRSTSSL